MFNISSWLRRQAQVAPEEKKSTPAAVAEAADRRQAVRRGGPPVEVMVRDGYRPTPAAGWIRNRSTGGLAISCQDAYPEGAILHVRVTVAPDSTPWTPLLVRACTPFVNGWMLHGQFAESPADEARLLFG